MKGTPIGRFQILGTLGTGAHSSILHIRRSADGRQYALKVVPVSGPEDAKYVEQAHHEFRVAHLLDHPNLTKIYALEAKRDWLMRTRKIHLLIEYVNGQTLDTLKELAVPKLVQIFARVASGLAHMHRRKIFHADLKPGNIILSRTGEVKIIDYGLAWIRGQSKGRVQGTPEYMAPEQVKDSTVNERTDIYNFGATMYRLTTWRFPPNPIVASGGLPLDARSWQQLLKPVPECNQAAPAELCELIHQCVAFNPDQRPESMNDVRDTLERMTEELVKTPEDRLEGIEWER